jgi:type VI secretion system secreted protein VgrG
MTTSDFTFAWEHADAPDGPWAHLQVVRFHGREELSSLYRYDLTLLAKTPAPDVDPRALIGARATLRIATLTEPADQLVHGILVEAEEIAHIPDGMLYRVVLMPPLVRARHRTRCRIFLEKTTQQIINAVLQGDPNLSLHHGATVDHDSSGTLRFTPAAEKFTWRLQDPSRLDDVRVRPYCVQYNESDLAFVSRLLEEEGISYHIENGAGLCLLVLSDADQGRARLDPFEPLGSEVEGRHVSNVRLGARLREKKVRLGEYDWRTPTLDLSAERTSDHADLFGDRYPGGYADAPLQGEPLARARLDRHHIEAEYVTFDGTCRMLSAGSVFRLDHAKGRYDSEYLVTKLDVRGEQHGVASVSSTPHAALPFACAFECARRGHGSATRESRFRPPRGTPKPRIVGSQTAFVTADPSARGAEIHVGGPPGAEIGCVRLRFHWDKEQERLAKEPSSCWVRVSQIFAGAGEGGLFHPRVGTEVIVEFLDGDPDRPIVTGRVYNGRNRPPAGACGSPTVSSIKSSSSPGGGKHNELSFDDAAGSEQIKLHAGKNWDSEVGYDRSERVTNHSTSSVGVNRTEATGGNRTTQVKGSNTETIDGDEAIAVQANQRVSVSADRSLSVGANQSIFVSVNQTSGIGANRSATIGADDSLAVGGNRSVSVSGNLGETVGGNAQQSVAGNRAVSVSGASSETVTGSRAVSVSGAMTHTVAGAVARSGAASVTEAAGASFALTAGTDAGITAGANLSFIAAAQAVLQGAGVHINAAGEIVLSGGGSAIKISGAGVEITGAAIKIAGGSVDVTGNPVKIN